MARRQMVSREVKAIAALSKHIGACTKCRRILQSDGHSLMCDEGVVLTHEAARAMRNIVPLHMKALKDPNGTFYPCPDVKKHGQAYAMTAQPMMGTAIQEGLF